MRSDISRCSGNSNRTILRTIDRWHKQLHKVKRGTTIAQQSAEHQVGDMSGEALLEFNQFIVGNMFGIVRTWIKSIVTSVPQDNLALLEPFNADIKKGCGRPGGQGYIAAVSLTILEIIPGHWPVEDRIQFLVHEQIDKRQPDTIKLCQHACLHHPELSESPGTQVVRCRSHPA